MSKSMPYVMTDDGMNDERKIKQNSIKDKDKKIRQESERTKIKHADEGPTSSLRNTPLK